jgi:hypothetical protein
MEKYQVRYDSLRDTGGESYKYSPPVFAHHGLVCGEDDSRRFQRLSLITRLIHSILMNLPVIPPQEMTRSRYPDLLYPAGFPRGVKSAKNICILIIRD